MDFSKKDIVSRHFSKTFRGLNEFEVRDYLSVLAEEIQRFQQLCLQQKEQIEDQSEMIEESRAREHILKESITVVQKITEKMRKDAESQSEMILQSARDNKERIIKEARESLQGVYEDIASLKRLYIQFKTSLTASVKAHLELLEQDSFISSSLLESSSSETVAEDGEEASDDQYNPPPTVEAKTPLEPAESFPTGKADATGTPENAPPKEAVAPEEESSSSIAKSLKSLSEEFL